MSTLQDQFLDTSGMQVETLESFGRDFIEYQRGINWWIGDVARAARHKLGDDRYTQVFPETASPGLIQRCEAVAKAYPTPDDRNPLASWATHMQHANRPDRRERVAASVEAGRTSDEERQHESNGASRWLLAVDVNYFLHRFWFSGAGVEAADGVASWINRTVDRLKEKGLTDVACCFDAPNNHRKELTADWDDKYKDRPKKDDELVHQLQLVHDLISAAGFACVKVEGMEADDCMASFAKQFEGRVTLLTRDKDCRQCLSEKTNMLLDVEWAEDPTSGEMLPEYKWLSAKQHTDETGIPPSLWTEFQSLMGDACDGVKGAIGIGEKGAKDLVQAFGNCEAVIQAAKDGDESIKPKKREALIAFEDKLDVTRKLVTLRDDLEIPHTTKV